MAGRDASGLFDSALDDLRKGYTARAATRMRQAAEMGHAPARLAYARKLFDVRAARAQRDACRWLSLAAEDRLPAALYARSAARYAGLCGEPDAAGALADLNAAATLGHAEAESALALAWLEHGGREARTAASAWFARSAAHGGLLGRLLLRGRHLDGHPRGDAGAPPGLRAFAPVTERSRELLHRQPVVAVSDAGLNTAECAWLRLTSRPGLKESRVLDHATGRPRPHPVRTSTTTYLAPTHLQLPALRLTERLARHAGAPPETAEPLAVLRYRPGQEYRAHRDALGPDALKGDPLAPAGDRSATVLCYLNRPARGGETTFPKLDLSVRPEPGRILVFENLGPEGEPESLALHAGLPVTLGTKWLASLWIRQRALPRDAPNASR